VTDVADQTIFRKSSENERRYIVLDTDKSIEPYRFRADLSTRRSFLDAEVIEDEDEEDDELHRDPSVSFTEGLPPCHDGIAFGYEVESESAQRENNLPLYESISLKDASGCEARSGCIINAGSYVYSTDWAPNNEEDRGQHDMEFLAIAAALTPWQRSNVTERLRKGSAPATVQIWSIAASDWKSALSMVLCFEGGRISSIRWCPTVSPANSSNRSLGIVAIAMQDGGVGIYDVPDPSSIPSKGDGVTVYLKPIPLIFFDTNRGVPMALAWYNSAMLAVAYSDGYVGVWDVKDALTLTDTAAVRPSLYARISRSPLSDITWDAQGSHIYSSALDGSVYATSLDQPDFSTTLAHSRDVAYPIAYDRTLGAPIFERLEDASIRVVDFHDKLASRAIYPHYGRVRALCTSPHHPFVASGSADGSVKTANVPIVMENHRRWAGSGMTTIFRLDMTDRKSASLRFVDGFMTMPLTREPPNEVQAKYGSGKEVITGPARFGLTMGWHPAIGVTTVRWNTNVGRETWLATGLGVGLVRVDMVGR
jgi:WD40 repeat protein